MFNNVYTPMSGPMTYINPKFIDKIKTEENCFSIFFYLLDNF